MRPPPMSGLGRLRPRPVPGLGQVAEVLRGVVEVEDHRLDPAEVRPQPVLQPGPAVGERDPAVGPVHADLRRLPPQRLAQASPGPPGWPGSGPARAAAAASGRPSGRDRRGRVVDHRHGGHPPVGLGGLRAPAGGPPWRRARRRRRSSPRRPCARPSPGPAPKVSPAVQASAELLAGRLGGPLDGGLGDLQTRPAAAGSPRRPRRSWRGPRRGRPPRRRPGVRSPAARPSDLIAGAMAPMARLAVVIGPLGADRPEQAERALGAVADEAGRLVAVRATQARPSVPPFFRSLRAASMALAPILWTRSRTSNSVGPEELAVGLGGEQLGEAAEVGLGGLAERSERSARRARPARG